MANIEHKVKACWENAETQQLTPLDNDIQIGNGW